jgi:hypothetical protein
MSLDLFVLTPANAASFDKAIAVVMEETPGTPDDSGELEAYAKEVYDAYGDDWPFGGDPIVEDGFVQLVVAPDAWGGRGSQARRACALTWPNGCRSSTRDIVSIGEAVRRRVTVAWT